MKRSSRCCQDACQHSALTPPPLFLSRDCDGKTGGVDETDQRGSATCLKVRGTDSRVPKLQIYRFSLPYSQLRRLQGCEVVLMFYRMTKRDKMKVEMHYYCFRYHIMMSSFFFGGRIFFANNPVTNYNVHHSRAVLLAIRYGIMTHLIWRLVLGSGVPTYRAFRACPAPLDLGRPSGYVKER